MEQKNNSRGKANRHPNFRQEHDFAWSSLPMRLIFVVGFLFFVVLGYDQLRGNKNTSPANLSPSVDGPADTAAPNKPSPAKPKMAKPTGMPNHAEATDSANTARARQVSANPQQSPDEKLFETMQFVMEKDSLGNIIGMGSINGKNVRFLADTGATMVVVPEKVANQIGLRKGAPIPFKTGGGIIIHYSTTLDTLTLGQIEIRNVAAAINPAMQDEIVLLGMSALGLMDMQMEKGNLILRYTSPFHDAVEPKPNIKDEPFKRSYKDCVKQGNKFDKKTLDCLEGK